MIAYGEPSPEKSGKTCICASCSCDRLADPRFIPTAAETWLTKTKQVNAHMDGVQAEEYIRKFGYAILNAQTAELLRPYGPLLEVGAGLGYWASELQQRGIYVVATDPHPEDRWPDQHPWTRVHRMDGLTALRTYPGYNLLLCWPETADWPADVVDTFRHRHLIYVGEDDPTGATGGETMFEALSRNYTLVQDHRIPRFAVAVDRLFVYERNNAQRTTDPRPRR